MMTDSPKTGVFFEYKERAISFSYLNSNCATFKVYLSEAMWRAITLPEPNSRES